MARLDASVHRLLTAKARLGLHLSRAVDLGDVASHVGGRQHAAVARTVSERGLTLVRNKPRHVPLDAPRSTRVLRALGARLSRQLADCGAGPHVHPGDPRSVARRDGHRAVRSQHAVGARSRPRVGAGLWRDRDGDLRPRRVGERPSRSRGAGGEAGQRPGAPLDAGPARRGASSSGIRMRRRACRTCRRCS